MKRKTSLKRHETELHRALRRALLVVLAAPAGILGAQACGSDNLQTSPLDAGMDVSIITDASVDVEPEGSSVDFDGGPCAPTRIKLDAKAPDGGIECGVFQSFACGVPPGQTVFDDCYFLLNDCPAVCPGSLYFNCHVYGDGCDGGVVRDAGAIIIECASCPNGVGRRPYGFTPSLARGPKRNAIGEYFAKAAQLEAASVDAFRILRSELEAHGAPAELLRAARRAERDEVRHAKATTKIARSYGEEPDKVRVVNGPSRSLEEVARENAVEGCVRETFGALVALWQAERAADPDVTRVMRKIAIDEARHAALAWAVAAWAEERLDVAARTRIAEAREKAVAELERELTISPAPELVRHAGVPSATVSQQLLEQLRRSILPIPAIRRRAQIGQTAVRAVAVTSPLG